MKARESRPEVAADTIARLCNADSASKFHGVTRIYLTVGDLEQLHRRYVADGVPRGTYGFAAPAEAAAS